MGKIARPCWWHAALHPTVLAQGRIKMILKVIENIAKIETRF